MPYLGKKPADIIATAVDTTTGTFSGAVSAASVDADGGVTVDNITIDGTEIDLSSGDLTLDVAGDLTLDVGGGDIILKDDGTEFGNIANSSSDLQIVSIVQDKDIILRGNDGGSFINALTLDMSVGGMATIANGLVLSDGNIVFADGHGLDFSNTSGSASGSASALFDDYEEGTWTPATSSSSYNTASSVGRYTKIGRIVVAHFSINFSGVNSSSNSVCNITNFPFTNSDQIAVCGSARESNNTGAIYVTRIGVSTTTATMNSMDNVTSGSQRTIRTSEDYVGTLTYMTS